MAMQDTGSLLDVHPPPGQTAITNDERIKAPEYYLLEISKVSSSSQWRLQHPLRPDDKFHSRARVAETWTAIAGYGSAGDAALDLPPPPSRTDTEVAPPPIDELDLLQSRFEALKRR